MKTVSKLLSLVLAVAVLITMSACGAQKTDDESTTTGGATTQSEVKTAEKVTLKILTSQLKENIDKDSRVKALYNAIDTYAAQNSNVEVITEAIASEPYNDKVKILAAGNELPDMLEVLGSWTKSFVETDSLMKLTEVINADAEWKAIIKPTATHNFIVDGETYGICLEEGGSTSLFFYNEAILKECGVATPIKTMTDLKEAIKLVKAKGYTPISLGNKGQWVGQSCYLSCLGGRYTGNEWNDSIINYGGAKFTDPEFVKGLTLMQELANLGAFNEDMNSIDYKQKNEPYYAKKAAMFIDGNWAINSLNADCPEDVLKVTHVTKIPDIEDAKVPNSLAGGNGVWAYSLNANLEGASKDAAIGLLKSVISTESAAIFYEGGNPSAINPGEYDKSKLSPLSIEFFEIMNTVPFSDTYDAVFSPSVIDIMNKGIQEILINTTTPEKLAEAIQAEYEASKE